MNWTVHKAILRAEAEQIVRMPKGAEILTAREQRDEICIWFRCQPENPFEGRRVSIVGTGHEAPADDNGRYIGTASLQNGSLIFHVFERLD